MPDPNTNTQTPPAGGAPQTPPPAAMFETIIPQEFRDRTYLADLKTKPVGPEAYTELFKKLDGAQSLIGKKTGIPEAGAPVEEWEKFHALMRPKTAEEYELATPKEGATPPDPEFAKAVKGMFFEAGLSKPQAAKLQAKFDEFISGKVGAQAAEQARLDAEFETMTKAAFGADNAKVLEGGKALLAELTPDNLKPHLNRLPNESLVLLAGIMGSVRAKFMKEDNLNGGGGGAPPATDTAALREQGRKLMSSDAYKDFRHADHAKTKAEVARIYEAIGKESQKK